MNDFWFKPRWTNFHVFVFFPIVGAIMGGIFGAALQIVIIIVHHLF